MTPEQKCVGQETARKLEAAGFPQDTERLWRSPLPQHGWPDWSLGGDLGHGSESFAAPDAQEIAEQLPFRAKWDTDVTGVFSNDWLPGEAMSPGGGGQRFFHFFYRGDENIHLHDKTFSSENEAEARAACWLYLKENKLI